MISGKRAKKKMQLLLVVLSDNDHVLATDTDVEF